jgi:hypothetical protein
MTPPHDTATSGMGLITISRGCNKSFGYLASLQEHSHDLPGEHQLMHSAKLAFWATLQAAAFTTHWCVPSS